MLNLNGCTHFLLQDEKEFEDDSVYVLRQILRRQRHLLMYDFYDVKVSFFSEDFSDEEIQELKTKAVPVGSIDFVAAYLKRFHGVDNMNPIEVPTPLRSMKFLRRHYSIITKEELLKKGGYAFVKNASKLKDFSYSGAISSLFYGDENFLKDDCYYVFSDMVNILSEYRVFVYNDNIQGIQYYDGDPLVMPTPEEIKTLRSMVGLWQFAGTQPKAYSMDIAIIEQQGDRYLTIIECHPFVSVGLYGFCNSSLPNMYRVGLDYYINKNYGIKPFSNYNEPCC